MYDPLADYFELWPFSKLFWPILYDPLADYFDIYSYDPLADQFDPQAKHI